MCENPQNWSLGDRQLFPAEGSCWHTIVFRLRRVVCCSTFLPLSSAHQKRRAKTKLHLLCTCLHGYLCWWVLQYEAANLQMMHVHGDQQVSCWGALFYFFVVFTGVLPPPQGLTGDTIKSCSMAQADERTCWCSSSGLCVRVCRSIVLVVSCICFIRNMESS